MGQVQLRVLALRSGFMAGWSLRSVVHLRSCKHAAGQPFLSIGLTGSGGYLSLQHSYPWERSGSYVGTLSILWRSS